MKRHHDADPLVATITLAADQVSEQTLVEILEPLSERLSSRAAAASMTLAPTRLTLDLNLYGDDLQQGLVDAEQAVTQTLAALDELMGSTSHACTLIAVTTETSAARDERLAHLERARDVVGIAEIAKLRSEMLGRQITPQSVQRTTQRSGFPAPTQILASGPIYPRAAVRDFFLLEDSRVRPRGTTEPAGTTPGLQHRQALAALLHDVQARGENLSPELGELAHRPHAILGSELTKVVTALGGAITVAGRLNVSPRTVQRWLAGAAAADPSHLHATSSTS